MKKSVVFNNQFTPKLGGQFELESGGQFAPELVVNLLWKVVVNLTGFSTYIVKPYFEAFLQEAGKQHFEILSRKLKTLINRGKQMNVRLISASKSTEKLNKAYNQSMAISILFEIKNGKIIKLLFDNDLEKEDWDNAIDQILEFVIENYENENNNKLTSIIKDFDNEKAFKIYALINKETKLVELYDDRSLMKKTREK